MAESNKKNEYTVTFFAPPKKTELAYQPCQSSSSQSSSSQSSHSFSQSSSSVSSKANEILYLLDRFGISDQFYHELSMLNEHLPRSYEVKLARAAISSVVEIKRLPTPHLGCYRPVKECIINAISAEVYILYFTNMHVRTCTFRLMI